jgi:hypothetical protein
MHKMSKRIEKEIAVLKSAPPAGGPREKGGLWFSDAAHTQA